MTARENLAEVDPDADGPSVGVPGGLSAGGAQAAREHAAERRADRSRRDQRAGARDRHRRAGRRTAVGVAGDAGIDVAAGRARGASRRRRPCVAGCSRRPTGHLSGSSSQCGLRTAGRSDRFQSREPLCPRTAALRSSPRAAADRSRLRRLRRYGGHRDRAAGSTRGAARATPRLVLDPARARCRRDRHPVGRWEDSADRGGPDRSSARHCRRRLGACLGARGRCLCARR